MLRGKLTKSSIVLLLIFWGSRVDAGKYANAFLEIGCGARALAMGGAVTADIYDGTAFYWNPAGLALIERVQMTGMYGPQFGTINDPLATYHQIGIAIPLRGQAVIAANWIRLAVDEIPIYPELEGNSFYERFMNASLRPSGEPEGYFSDSENAFFVSFAKRNAVDWDLGWDFHRVRIEIPVGLNIKWIKQQVGDNEASGLGIDAGGMLRIHLNDLFQIDQIGVLSFGLNIQDLTRTTMSWNTKRRDTVPHSVRFGVAYQQTIREKMILTLCIDRESRWDKRDRIGFEFSGWNKLALRAGADSGHITAGAGFHLWNLFVDYAFLSHELDALHRVSLSFSF